jgi:hypothetical protein
MLVALFLQVTIEAHLKIHSISKRAGLLEIEYKRIGATRIHEYTSGRISWRSGQVSKIQPRFAGICRGQFIDNKRILKM